MCYFFVHAYWNVNTSYTYNIYIQDIELSIAKSKSKFAEQVHQDNERAAHIVNIVNIYTVLARCWISIKIIEFNVNKYHC